ncbi:YcxB family protein [Streptomyces sp. NPDC047081]|uniref:YcxB family protein n=1 Tax=Streptomyces sp. NPDC047081 TaxID=3154706 RepID=UPI0033E6060B
MVMNMGRDAGQGVVELTYEPVVEDYAGALRARKRFNRAGKIQGTALILLGIAWVLNLAVSVPEGDPDWFLLIWMPVVAVLLLLTPQLQARQLMKVAARNGSYRVTVTDTGLTMANDHSTTSVNWTGQPRYRETKDAFVLYSDDKNATCFTVLPKRGLATPADADRLREILDRNLTRV